MEISDINNLKTGRIHLAFTNHLGTLVLPKVLPASTDLCANIRLDISEENTTCWNSFFCPANWTFSDTCAL